MNSLKRKIIVLLVIAFVALTGKVTLDLISLPEQILSELNIKESSKIKQATQIAFESYSLLGVDLIVVLVLIYFLAALGFDQRQEKVSNYTETNLQEESQSNENKARLEEEKRLSDRLNQLQKIIEENSNKSAKILTEKALSYIAKEVNCVTGALYISNLGDQIRYLELLGGYAFHLPDSQKLRFEFGEGIAGQAAKSKKEILLKDVPSGYINTISGLGSASPKQLFVVPILKNEEVIGLIEIANFQPFEEGNLEFIRSAGKLLLASFETAALASN